MRNYNQRRWRQSNEFQTADQGLSSSSKSFFGPNGNSKDLFQPPPVPMLYPNAQKLQTKQSNKWSSGMDAHSKLIINNDPQNLSHLSNEDQMQIKFFQNQIDELKTKKQPKKPLSAYEIFENKNFNIMKAKWPHQNAHELNELINSKWQNKIEESERLEYEKQAKDLQQVFHIEMENSTSKINQLKKKIHEIRFPFFQNAGGGNSGGPHNPSQHHQANQNEGIGYGTQIKPSGKIKFMSAYRFFRKEMVPIIKKQEQDLDGKGRHAVVHDLWQQLQDRHKLAYVLMSRADREKSLYIIRLNQIREELRIAFPQEFDQIQSQQNKNEAPAQREVSYQMHSLAALDQISEKINEEQNSDENDTEDEGDSYDVVPNDVKDFDRAEYLKSVNEKRARVMQRVLPQYLAKFEARDEKKPWRKHGFEEEITPCLLDPSSAQMSNIPQNYQNDSIFSQGFQEKNRWQQNKDAKY